MPLLKIIKRSGELEDFQPKKISAAIEKAFSATRTPVDGSIEKLTEKIVSLLQKKFSEKTPTVEQVQDVVVDVLFKEGFKEVGHAYKVWRERKAEERGIKKKFPADDLKFGANAMNVLCRRYLLKNEAGKIIETPSQLFRRVAQVVSEPDKKYRQNPEIVEEEFYQIMADREFLPNSPTFNAGTSIGNLSACFVLPIEDSLESIFQAIKEMALIQKSGGGTGFDFSKIRPKGDFVKSTQGIASGPLSFMEVFDATTNTIKQGSKRRGANMGILRFDHPDILEFISVKSNEKKLQNFNISVSVTDEFMKKVESGEDYWLINPRSGEKVKQLNAKKVFDLLCENAWKMGDPGLIFLDEINRKNPTAHTGEISATNPCSEQPLHSYESCNLGSINIGKFVKEKEKEIDWDRLKKIVWTAVHFLDNVIDANIYPLEQIEKITKANRRIGLGIMGWADLLFILGIPYNSEHALKLAEEVMNFIGIEGHKASVELGKKRGSFTNFKGSLWDKLGNPAMRNATITTIAPTGTLSIIAGCSSGIEPCFALSFIRNILEGTQLMETNWVFERTLEARGLYSHEILEKVAAQGGIQKLRELPEDMKKIFVTALDIQPEWHVQMQAAFQKFCDSGISKTVNLPSNATIEDVKKIYLLAWKLKCKTISVYRYGSKSSQVLYIGKVKKRKIKRALIAKEDYPQGECPKGVCSL